MPSMPRRLARLMLGLVAFGAGDGLIIEARLGNPPWDVFHQGISNHTPLSVGSAAIVVSFAVLVLWIPLRQRPGIGTLANAVVIGVMIDVVAAVTPNTASIWWRSAELAVGMVAVALGSGLYIGVHLGPGPRDGLMTGIARRGPSLRATRTAIEGTALLVGWLLGGRFGVGTVLFAVGIGPMVQWFLHRLAITPPDPRVSPAWATPPAE